VAIIGAAVGAALAYGYRKVRLKPQQRLNREAHEAFERVDAELQATLAKIRALALEDEQRREFEDAQRQWEAYRDAQASFDAVEVKGGTLWPLLFYSTMEELTRERLEALQNKYKYLAEYHSAPLMSGSAT
ncbi:MAG TPA: lysozyme inhibitor LprI family protein, partial [Chthoniobacterales bacterium]